MPQTIDRWQLAHPWLSVTLRVVMLMILVAVLWYIWFGRDFSRTNATPTSQLERGLPGLNNLMEDTGIHNNPSRSWNANTAMNHASARDLMNKGAYDYA